MLRRSTGRMNPAAVREEGLERVASALRSALCEVGGIDDVAIVFESPRNAQFGDFATNVAFAVAKRLRRSPADVAKSLAEALFVLDPALRDVLAEATAAGGFVNLRMTPAFWQAALEKILREGSEYGRGAKIGKHISLEFGSANPTGPLVVVQGRTLSVGGTLANAMRFAGYDVTTEWITNDAGAQLDTLSRTLYARYRQIWEPEFALPDDGYPGEYLVPIADEIRAGDGERGTERRPPGSHGACHRECAGDAQAGDGDPAARRARLDDEQR